MPGRGGGVVEKTAQVEDSNWHKNNVSFLPA